MATLRSVSTFFALKTSDIFMCSQCAGSNGLFAIVLCHLVEVHEKDNYHPTDEACFCTMGE